PRHVVVADDVLAVHRYVVARGQVADEFRGGLVEPFGEPGRTLYGEALLLDADRVRVHVPVARVPGDIDVGHHLGHGAVAAAHHVVGAGVVGRVLEVRHRCRVGLLGVVDDDVVDGQAVVRAV